MDYTEHTVRAADLQVGDNIVLARNKAGTPTRVTTVSTLEYGDGCKGMHVNLKRGKAPSGHPTPGIYTSMIVSCDGCYDSCAFVDVVRFAEPAPVG